MSSVSLTTPVVVLSPHEAEALNWIAARHHYKARMEVSEYRDRADVGWLDVTVWWDASTFSRTVSSEYRCSPTGRVFKRDGTEMGEMLHDQTYDKSFTAERRRLPDDPA